ncbi:MAG: hypothetical protein ACQEXJ_06715 [Myxococcota bacterium]
MARSHHALPVLAALAALLLLACGSDGDASTQPDADAAPDTTAPDTASTDDAKGDAGEPDTAPDVEPGCEDGSWTCSDDAKVLERCEDGELVSEDCAAQGRLCEEGACVVAARWGSPEWSTCPDGPSTPESLADKAAYYDDVAWRLHVHPELKFVARVDLPKEKVECPEGWDPPCYEPTIAEEDATWQDVERFDTDNNDGLWNALYMTSQAYRYATTGSAEALEHLRVLMEGERDRLEITGVPGVFTRRLIPPGLDAVQCPSDKASYERIPAKDSNQWVMIGEGGCARYVDPETDEWVTSDHCGLDDYAGWCFVDNVSQDEYAGHFYALGAIMRLVDDPEIRAEAADMLEEVAVHMMEHELRFVDWDGRFTEHGLIGSPPMILGWVKTAVDAGDNAELEAWYRDCLLQEEDDNEGCISWMSGGLSLLPVHEQLGFLPLFTGEDGCKTNWNNISMAVTAFQNVLWSASDPEIRALAQQVVGEQMVHANHPKALIHQQNPWYHFTWAAQKDLGPDSTGPAHEAVEDGVCALRRFPTTRAFVGLDATQIYEKHCESRLGAPLAEDPMPPEHRCPTKYLWWNSLYEIETCKPQPWRIYHPTDYLLPYWMGRYHGFIPEDL